MAFGSHPFSLPPQIQAPPPPAAEPTPILDTCTALYPFHRTLVSADMDRALALLGNLLDERLHYRIERYTSGTKAFTWPIPARWDLSRGRLSYAGGDTICDFREHPLHVVSYSLPTAWSGSWEKLLPRLHVGPAHLPDALPWVFKFYERDWGFCVSYNQYQRMVAVEREEPQAYDAEINVLMAGDIAGLGLGVARYAAPGAVGRDILISTNLCHPWQVNDSITGVAVAVELSRRLLNNPLPPRSRGVVFVFAPETIGSLAYASRHADLPDRTDAALCFEMLGTPGPLVLQQSRGGKADRITRIARHVGWITDFDDSPTTRLLRPIRNEMPFRDPRTALNDEIVWNGPGINIPTIALTRYPYPEYHTSADTPAILSEPQLTESLDVIEKIVRIAASDWTPVRMFRGPLFLSGLGLWTDWRVDPKMNAAMEQMMLHLDGGESIFDISQAIGIDYWQLRSLMMRLEEAGAVWVQKTKGR